MIGRARVAAKFFTLGVLLGVLFAPAAGAETRRRATGAVTGRLAALLGMDLER
jgi:hypothetical protein